MEEEEKYDSAERREETAEYESDAAAVTEDAEEQVSNDAESEGASAKKTRSDRRFYAFLVVMGLMLIGVIVAAICIFTGAGIGCSCSECVQ